MSIKLIGSCLQCDKVGLAFGELSNNEYHIITCKNGHQTKYISAMPEYPILFDNGMFAYHDENYFEAFTSLYTSWERFIFTFVKMILCLDDNISYSDALKYTKSIKNSSVQIEGVFSVIYSQYFKEKAPSIHQNCKKLRNKIIHGIHVPEKKDVEKAAYEIYIFIKTIELKLLFNNKRNSLFEVYEVKRQKYLEEKEIITEDERLNKKISLVSSGQYILGKTKGTNTEADGLKILSFEEISNITQGMKKFQNISHT